MYLNEKFTDVIKEGSSFKKCIAESTSHMGFIGKCNFIENISFLHSERLKKCKQKYVLFLGLRCG